MSNSTLEVLKAVSAHRRARQARVVWSELTPILQGLVLLREKYPERLAEIQPTVMRLMEDRGCEKCGSPDWMESPDGVLCLPCEDALAQDED